MAKSSAMACLQILSVLLLASLGQSNTVFTNLTVYVHEFQSGDAQSIFPVAGLPNVTWGYHQFGTVFVIDNTLTQSVSFKSAVVGRLQGISAVASLDGNNMELAATILFANGKYKGSTVVLKGIAMRSMLVNEVAIIGGTKQFRYATGYIISEVLSAVGGYLTLRLNLYIRQDIPDDSRGIAFH
ncbi:dirigent protein 22-like [Coffea eugenioides]|uniref:dirigent protein 22-like n=1 Tax=Coffea eugenioides TaxID=49369 RepID=UPI000F610F40|nr:dirigent protein 22-like [Coffea eugenioides]